MVFITKAVLKCTLCQKDFTEYQNLNHKYNYNCRPDFHFSQSFIKIISFKNAFL